MLHPGLALASRTKEQQGCHHLPRVKQMSKELRANSYVVAGNKSRPTARYCFPSSALLPPAVPLQTAGVDQVISRNTIFLTAHSVTVQIQLGNPNTCILKVGPIRKSAPKPFSSLPKATEQRMKLRIITWKLWKVTSHSSSVLNELFLIYSKSRCFVHSSHISTQAIQVGASEKKKKVKFLFSGH